MYWTNIEVLLKTTATFPSNPASLGNSLGTGWTFTHVFTVPGTYDYQCDPHAGMGMTGKVIVSAPCKGADKTIVFGVNESKLKI